MVSLSFLSLLPLLYISSRINATPVKRQTLNPDPPGNGSMENGWASLPAAVGADIFPDWSLGNSKNANNATIPVYLTSDRDTRDIKRAVITLSGKARDCWYYWNMMHNGLITAASKFDDVVESEIAVMAPCFMIQEDLAAGAATPDNILYGRTTWISGHKNVAPEGTDMSSYDVMDFLVEQFFDKEVYPNLETLIIAGHSAGGQMSQRYGVMRKVTDHDSNIRFWVANPGSILWLSEDRPAPNADCEGVDDFKYGLSNKIPAYSTADYNNLGREGIVARYFGRNVDYAWGLNDDGPGDTRCQAVTQGVSHLERGQNFVAMMETINNGSLPDATTVDYIPGVSHDPWGMIIADAGLEKLFRFPTSG